MPLSQVMVPLDANLAAGEETGAVGFLTMVWFLVLVYRNGLRTLKDWTSDVNGAVGLGALLGVAGAGHFITVLRRNGDSYVVGDPLFGRLTLAAADLRTRYRFTGFFMIVRLSNSGAPSCL